MAGRNFRFGLMAGACCAALGFFVPAASAQAGTEPGTPFELAFWQAVSASNDPVLYEAYLKQYPTGTFAAIAHVKVESQHKVAAPTAAVPLPVPQFGQQFGQPVAQARTSPLASDPGAASALRDAAAAQRTAEAVQAAAAAVLPPPSATMPIPADSPVVTALAAPSAPMAAPSFHFAPSASDAAHDLFGNAAAMPVASAALLASLSGEARTSPLVTPSPQTPTLVAPAMPTPAPMLALAAPVPEAPAPVASAPIASPVMLAALGAAPAALPTADALRAAVASQVTPAAPVRLARAEPVLPQPAYAPAPVQRQAAAYAPPSRSRRYAREAQFMRAVVSRPVASTAAVSVEMPDVTNQISPLGIMLGQLVRSQETPGTQYGLQEEVSMPLRPRLMAMPEVALPESFCSAEQRSAFTEGVYQPALAIAAHNAEVASAYVRKLRTLYDNYQLNGDSTSEASVAAEARDFARAARAAGSIHDALVNQFEDIMNTPVGSCGAIQ